MKRSDYIMSGPAYHGTMSYEPEDPWIWICLEFSRDSSTGKPSSLHLYPLGCIPLVKKEWRHPLLSEALLGSAWARAMWDGFCTKE